MIKQNDHGDLEKRKFIWIYSCRELIAHLEGKSMAPISIHAGLQELEAESSHPKVDMKQRE